MWALLLFLGAAVVPIVTWSAPVKNAVQEINPGVTVDIEEPVKPVLKSGADAGGFPRAGNVAQDTIWIADWSFDPACTSTGWVKYDARILNDGSNYWGLTSDFAGAGGGTITGRAAVLRKHDLCWSQDGYGNSWDYSIILKYSGSSATLAFKYVADSEVGYDFVSIEADSLGLSEALVNYVVAPADGPEAYRLLLYVSDGDQSAGVNVGPIALPDFGPGMHEVYIRFESDRAYSDEDGFYPTVLQAGLVVDDVVVTGGTNYSESFAGALNPNVTFANSAPATPFGEWARLFLHFTDNDKCTENTTCAWIFTDPTRIALFPDMEFGPGSAVVRNWLDDVIVSPWVSLASTPSAQGTVLSSRIFPGNRFLQSRIQSSWRVRGKVKVENTDTSSSGDSIDCLTPWAPVDEEFRSLSRFSWSTSITSLSSFVLGDTKEVQVAFRVTDRQLLGVPPPTTLNTGPGPYLDRVRIGRHVISGPVFDLGLDTRYQGNDNFASTVNAIPGPNPHYSPSTDRFGSCDFRQGTDQGTLGTSTQIVSGDSVTTDVIDVRLTGGITSVKWYGAIIAGPHAGDAPAPYTVGGNGFFEVTPDTSRTPSGVAVANRWFVSLNDTYLRGGDDLVSVWVATDAGGGTSSAPSGLTAVPTSVASAEVATGGLFEVNCLPTINWPASYANDPNDERAPTAGEIAAATQKNCVLYYQHTNDNRRSGPTNATSFMRTLNALGYKGDYDVYDPQGYGNTNNQLASRASVAQCTGYQLIIEDDGRSNLIPNVPDGASLDDEKVTQATFYRSWLDNGLSSSAGRATLWILGESTVAEYPTNALFTTYAGVGAVTQDQALSVNPDVVGQTSFTFAPSGCVASFAGDVFALNGGCPVLRNYDGYTASGTAVSTHRYRAGTTLGSTAILMNRRPATNANTILMGFPWFDIRSPFCTPPGCPTPSTPAKTLMSKILACALTAGCQQHNVTDAGGTLEIDAPAISALHANVPNPFNPTTRITFDVARAGRVTLAIHDVAGRRVKTLVNHDLPARRGHIVMWDGLDDAGRHAASGVYFLQLVAPDLTATRKLLLLE